ncbi:23905_t:CDS:1, partial [Gigaspora margarita]
QASELIYIDTIASLDFLNILLTIISTSMPVRGLPLATILTLNETTQTVTKALDAMKNMLLLDAFGGHGSTIGLQVIITNNYRAERNALCCTWKKTILLLYIFYFLQAA